MATINQNKKDGKIISFKFKAFLGRNEKGKQIFQCKTWKCNQKIPEIKLVALAEKEATIWEHELMKKNQDKKTKIITC